MKEQENSRNCGRRLDFSLYAITPAGCALTDIEAALRGGATVLQLRDKELTDTAFAGKAREVLALCRRYQVPLIINDRVGIAKEIGADGVHVGQSDMRAARARELLGPDRIVGVTARTLELARAAAADGADYLGAGAVFGTTTKADARPLSVQEFRSVTESVQIPVVAIGGICVDNAMALAGSGLAGLAVVSGLFGAADIEAEARRLLAISHQLQQREVAL